MSEAKSYAKGCGIGCLVLIPVAFFGFLAVAIGVSFGAPEVLNGVALKYGALALLLLILTIVSYRKVFKTEYKRKEKTWTRIGNVMAVGTIFVELLLFCFFWGATEYDKNDDGQSEGWTAESIELPHLKDGDRYTSNPDSLLTKETVAAVDSIMGLMDRELDIEGAVVVVRRTKNADIFRFCQDLFDLYGIGKNDRGIVIAVAVDDHEARIHTGSALEADLTDLETNRLQTAYLRPMMIAGKTDEGVRLLTEACFQLLASKDMPVVPVEQTAVEDPSKKANRLGGIFMAILAASLFIIYMARYTYCADTPFFGFISSGGDGDSSGSSSYYSSSSSGSSRSSGGYSGGRSRGGGATVRW